MSSRCEGDEEESGAAAYQARWNAFLDYLVHGRNIMNIALVLLPPTHLLPVKMKNYPSARQCQCGFLADVIDFVLFYPAHPS